MPCLCLFITSSIIMAGKIELVFGRPLQVTVHPMLWDHWPVCNVGVLWPNVGVAKQFGWIKMPLGIEVGLVRTVYPLLILYCVVREFGNFKNKLLPLEPCPIFLLFFRQGMSTVTMCCQLSLTAASLSPWTSTFVNNTMGVAHSVAWIICTSRELYLLHCNFNTEDGNCDKPWVSR